MQLNFYRHDDPVPWQVGSIDLKDPSRGQIYHIFHGVVYLQFDSGEPVFDQKAGDCNCDPVAISMPDGKWHVIADTDRTPYDRLEIVG